MTDVPGTTRDLVTEVVDIEGLRVTLVDTAGLRERDDAVEAEGVARVAPGHDRVADLVLAGRRSVAPRDGLAAQDQAIRTQVLVVANKMRSARRRMDATRMRFARVGD